MSSFIRVKCVICATNCQISTTDLADLNQSMYGTIELETTIWFCTDHINLTKFVKDLCTSCTQLFGSCKLWPRSTFIRKRWINVLRLLVRGVCVYRYVPSLCVARCRFKSTTKETGSLMVEALITESQKRY